MCVPANVFVLPLFCSCVAMVFLAKMHRNQDIGGWHYFPIVITSKSLSLDILLWSVYYLPHTILAILVWTALNVYYRLLSLCVCVVCVCVGR